MKTERALCLPTALPVQSVIALDRQLTLVHFRQLVFIMLILKPISFLQLVIHIPPTFKYGLKKTAMYVQMVLLSLPFCVKR